jgi:hypothetical protein
MTLPGGFRDFSAYRKFSVDLVRCGPRSMTVREQATGRECDIGYDDTVYLGPNEGNDGYELILPAWMAAVRGLGHAH